MIKGNLTAGKNAFINECTDSVVMEKVQRSPLVKTSKPRVVDASAQN